MPDIPTTLPASADRKQALSPMPHRERTIAAAFTSAEALRFALRDRCRSAFLPIFPHEPAASPRREPDADGTLNDEALIRIAHGVLVVRGASASAPTAATPEMPAPQREIELGFDKALPGEETT